MLIVLSSCGIPTIANFDDFITVGTLSSSTDQFTISLDSTLGYSFRSNSPGLLLMYNITDITSSSSISTYTFDNTYGQTSSGRPVNFNNDYNNETSTLKVQGAILNRTLPSNSTDSSENYHTALFPFVPESFNNYANITASGGYTYNLNSILSSNGGTAVIKLEYNEVENCIDMTVGQGDTIRLKRFNGNQFLSYSDVIQSGSLNNTSSAEEYGDYWYFRNDIRTGDNGIRINIYAAVNIMGNFSNLYWSNLKYVGYIDIN